MEQGQGHAGLKYTTKTTKKKKTVVDKDAKQ